MKLSSKLIVLLLVGLLVISASAMAKPVTVPQGTQVALVFDQALSSKTAKVGQTVALHVKNDVSISKMTVLPAGTKVSGTISKVDKRQRYGINAQIRIALNPVKSTYGKMIYLEPIGKGKQIGGTQTEKAAGATVGGAVVLGPVGLIGGYFVPGKRVTIKAGDPLMTEVSKTVVLKK